MSVLQVRHWKLTACVLYSLISGFWWDYNSKNIFALIHTAAAVRALTANLLAVRAAGKLGEITLPRTWTVFLNGKSAEWKFLVLLFGALQNFCSNSSSSSTQTDMDGGMDTDTELYAKFRCHRKSFSFNRCSSSQFPQQMFVLNYIQLQFAASLLAWFWILNSLQLTQLHMGKSKHNRIAKWEKCFVWELAIVYEHWFDAFQVMHNALCANLPTHTHKPPQSLYVLRPHTLSSPKSKQKRWESQSNVEDQRHFCRHCTTFPFKWALKLKFHTSSIPTRQIVFH